MKKMAFLIFCMALAAITNAGEVMLDRCGQMVAIVPSYDDTPNTPGTVILRRRAGFTNWTQPFTVKLSPEGRIRWWCQPAEGQLFVPEGTWRINRKKPFIGLSGSVDVSVTDFTDYGAILSPRPSTVSTGLTFTSSVWKGWTKERSRCDNRSTRIRARLGPWNELRIECLGK
jgi:hypothetical protein